MRQPDDLRVYDEASGPVLRWLVDLDDLLGAVAVAGLAWPDPDLADDLRALAGRARALGAQIGAGLLEALAEVVVTVRTAESSSARGVCEGQAFAALMGLISWERRFRGELDRVAVAAALVVRGTSEGVDKRRRGPVASAQLGPIGVELAGDRLRIYALDPETGALAVLMDQLSEIDDADPLWKPAISRLFQSRVRLGDVLAGRVALMDHPVRARGGLSVFRPAFDAAARTVPAVGHLSPSPVQGSWPGAGVPGLAPMRLGREGERILLEWDGKALAVPETAVLRFTSTKLAIREGPMVEVTAIARMHQGVPTLLAVDGPDGRSWPGVDPRAFPLSVSGLLALAADSPWLAATLAAYGGPDSAQAVAESSPDGVVPAYRVGRAARALGIAVPAPALGWAGAALVDPDGGADDRWRAIWLIVASDAVDRYEATLRQAWQRWYALAPKQPTPGDLCARSALMALLDVGGTDEQPAHDRALAYLDAHLAALRISARAREPRLPSLEALSWLAETRLMLTGDGGSTPLAVLDLPADRLRLLAIEAIWTATRAAPSTAASDGAGDGVWAMRLAGLGAQLFG